MIQAVDGNALLRFIPYSPFALSTLFMTLEALAIELKKELKPQQSGLTDIDIIKKFAKGLTRWELKYCFNSAKDVNHFKSLINETCERNIRIKNIESKK